MPATDDFKFDPMAAPNSPASYRSRFSHDDEKAVPGYYRVLLRGLEGQGGIDGHTNAPASISTPSRKPRTPTFCWTSCTAEIRR